MCIEFDNDMDIVDSFDSGADCGSFDVDSIMDATPDVSDVEDFSDFEVEEDSLDVDSIMDEAALDDTDFFEDDLMGDTEIVEDSSVEDLLEDTEIIEETPVEEIAEEPEVLEEALVEEIDEEPEVLEETPIEEIAEEPEVLEETPVEEFIEETEILEETPIEEIAEEPEVLEETPVEEFIEETEILEETPIEEIAEEPEVLEETPVEEFIEETEILEETPIEEIAEEPEVLEETPVEEFIEEPEVLEETPIEEIAEEPEVLEETPVEEFIEGTEILEEPPVEEFAEETEILEEPPVEEFTEEPEILEEPPVEEFTEEPEVLEETPVEEITEETQVSEGASDFGPGPAQTAMGEYLAEHNYGREDYAEYSQDPQWQQLNNDLLVELGQEPIDYGAQSGEVSDFGPGPAQTAMGEYLAEHNYGREDYAEYSQDPQWQQLNNDLLVELGQEPIDYGAQSGEVSDFGPGPAQAAMGEYLAEHNYGREDYAEYSQDPQWQQLNNDLLVELGQDPVDYGSQDIPEESMEVLEETPDIPEENQDVIAQTMDIPAEADELPEIPLADEMIADTTPVSERVYDDFEETVRLDQEDFYESGTFYTQGINEYGYEGTCGETSMASTMNRVLGTNEYTENKVLDVAVQEGLCDTTSLDNSGGTTTDQFMELYEKMNETCGDQLNVERHDFENVLSMEEVAQRLEEGCTINVAVDSATLWDQTDPMGTPFPESRATDHWITVTDVRRDEAGNIQGFDIVDSGGGENYVDADKYEAMCYGTEDLELTDPTCIVVSKKDMEMPVADMPAEEILPELSQEIPETLESITGLPPNDTYESNGYTYQTDREGRIISASGELHLVDDHIRDPEAQLLAGGDDRAIHDDGGHLIATRFGGSPSLDNLVAENAFVNRSQYKQLENAWARDLEAGNRVLVNIEPFYGTPGQRPTQIAGDYTVIRPDGSSYKEYFSITNEDMRSPEFAVDFDMGMGDSFYNDLTPAQQLDYQVAMEEKPLKIDEGRVFHYDETYEQFSACPEDSDAAFELQRVIHQPGRKR